MWVCVCFGVLGKVCSKKAFLYKAPAVEDSLILYLLSNWKRLDKKKTLFLTEEGKEKQYSGGELSAVYPVATYT